MSAMGYSDADRPGLFGLGRSTAVLSVRVSQQYADAGPSVGGQCPVEVEIVKPRNANRIVRRV